MEKVVSTEALDYAQFIIYYKKANSACDKILEAVVDYHGEVILQNVDEMTRDKRPSWLLGIPTVVKLPEYNIFRGTEALNLVEEWCSRQLSGTKNVISGVSGDNSNIPTSDLSNWELPLFKTSKYEEQPPCEDSNPLEELMRRRSRVPQPPPPC
jgi:hypothetical protein